MEIITTRTTTKAGALPVRQAAVNGLAVVGFIALVFIGITLAIYAARYVPSALSRISTANVFLSIFGKGHDADLEVVPTTVPFDNSGLVATSTATTTTPVATTTAPVVTTRPATTPVYTGPQTTGTYVIGTQPASPANYFGKPDLIVTILSTGYLSSNDTNSYIVSKTVPNGKRGAFKFRVTNVGTNVSGRYEFKAELPTTSSGFTFTSPTQDSLRPSEYVDFVLGFDKTDNGKNRTVSVTVDSARDVSESNESNNDDSASITID
ncbi:MAG: hypothetical protein JWR77_2701 [Rhizorhabdus sp.]|nr:hypothetical protein [Rhizorhabdus sp.]